jgi:RNA polymerase sigma factor (sigma-70 family)
LTRAIACGDSAAFARFYNQWFNVAYTEARRASGGCDEQFCLDVVQDSMMRVIRSIKPMESTIDIQRWLCVVVRSCCHDRLRKEARIRRRERASARLASPAIEADLDDQLEWLRHQLSCLDGEQVKLLNLRFRLGWTLHRIGSALGLKPGAVDGRITRCLAGLRDQAREDLHES